MSASVQHAARLCSSTHLIESMQLTKQETYYATYYPTYSKQNHRAAIRKLIHQVNDAAECRILSMSVHC